MSYTYSRTKLIDKIKFGLLFLGGLISQNAFKLKFSHNDKK